MTYDVLVKFDDNFPSGEIAAMRAQLQPFLFLLRREIVTLKIRLKGPGEIEGEAAMLVKRRYHTAHLLIDPSFFALPHDEKLTTILHEFMHVLLDPLTREIHHLILHQVPEDQQEYISWRLEDAEERLTDGLAHAFYELLGGDHPRHAVERQGGDAQCHRLEGSQNVGGAGGLEDLSLLPPTSPSTSDGDV